MTATHDTPLLRMIQNSAKTLTEEVGFAWEDIPGAIAESALFETISLVYETEGPDYPVSGLAGRLGFLSELGELE